MTNTIRKIVPIIGAANLSVYMILSMISSYLEPNTLINGLTLNTHVLTIVILYMFTFDRLNQQD